jgi:iron complex transport system substrate-binding protein
MPRVVSLIPSATEIVCALGLEEQLVGRSHECDYPPVVQRLPACTSAKFKVDGTSSEIDGRVKAIVERALSVYRVDVERLEQLAPTHILTQSQCEVCAVSLKDVEQAVCQLTRSQPVIVSLEPNALADVWSDIARVGLALGARVRAEELIAQLQQRMGEIRDRTHRLAARPSVACIEWIEPLMATGNWIPEMVEMAGGVNLFGERAQHSAGIRWREITDRDPEVIVVMPCGFGIERTLQEAHVLTRKTEWESLKAVRNGRVFVVDGNQYFNRPGPRLVESLQILAEILHPEGFDFGHDNRGWVRLTAAGDGP